MQSVFGEMRGLQNGQGIGCGLFNMLFLHTHQNISFAVGAQFQKGLE
jgi:hypothetical protein